MGVTLGTTYFQSFKNFADAKYTFCLPLGSEHFSNTVEIDCAGYSILKNQVEYIEIGDEPNSYPAACDRKNIRRATISVIFVSTRKR